MVHESVKEASNSENSLPALLPLCILTVSFLFILGLLMFMKYDQ